MSQLLKSGELYFLGERDFLTGKNTNYVKIGLVWGEDRDTEARIKEHQTGNPREIFNYHTLEVKAISKIETILHKIYAKYRVSGEWFVFDEEKLKEAIQKANELKSEIEKNEKYLSDAELASKAKPEDLQDSRTPSQEELTLLEKIKNLEIESLRLHFEKDIIITKLKLAMQNHAGIEGILKVELKEEKESFDTARLKKENPELYEKYIEPKTDTKRKFEMEIKNPTKPKLFGERYKEWKKENDQVPDDYSQLKKSRLNLTDDLKKLHKQYLETYGKAEAIDFELTLQTKILEGICGYSKGIDDVCTYDFEDSTTNSFLREKFREEHSDLYQKYLKKSEAGVKYTVLDWRPYAD